MQGVLLVLYSIGFIYRAPQLSFAMHRFSCRLITSRINRGGCQHLHACTKLLEEIDAGNFPLFTELPAPPMARNYWQLKVVRDVILAIRGGFCGDACI
jgi:hypothetical protein